MPSDFIQPPDISFNRQTRAPGIVGSAPAEVATTTAKAAASQAMNGWRTRCPPTGSSWQFLSSALLTAFAFEAYLNHVGPKIFEAWDRFAQIAASGKAGPQRGLICAWDWYEHRILLEP